MTISMFPRSIPRLNGLAQEHWPRVSVQCIPGRIHQTVVGWMGYMCSFRRKGFQAGGRAGGQGVQEAEGVKNPASD